MSIVLVERSLRQIPKLLMTKRNGVLMGFIIGYLSHLLLTGLMFQTSKSNLDTLDEFRSAAELLSKV
jgi:hypothetical protein